MSKLIFNGLTHHSGRANARRSPGPAHPTMGCIRTTDEAMRVITTSIPTDPLSTVEVINNSAPVAKSASQKNHQRRVLVHHHA